jgi:hypothetical protein
VDGSHREELLLDAAERYLHQDPVPRSQATLITNSVLEASLVGCDVSLQMKPKYILERDIVWQENRTFGVSIRDALSHSFASPTPLTPLSDQITLTNSHKLSSHLLHLHESSLPPWLSLLTPYLPTVLQYSDPAAAGFAMSRPSIATKTITLPAMAATRIEFQVNYSQAMAAM